MEMQSPPLRVKKPRSQKREGVWLEQSRSTKSPSRAVVRFKDGKVQILIEVHAKRLVTEGGGTVVVIADEDVVASTPVPVGDQMVQPHVAFRVYARFGPKAVEMMRRRRKVKQYSPVLFTSL